MAKLSTSMSVGAAAVGALLSLIPLAVYAQTTIPLCEIQRSLTVGSIGEDVRCLQRYLNWSGFTVSSTGSGAPGLETTYFGPRTASAVARWQNANAATVLAPLGIAAGTGYWGPSSFNAYVALVRTALGVHS